MLDYKRCLLLVFVSTLLISIGMPLALAPIAYADGFPIIGTLHSGKGPEAMAMDTQTHLLYIAHESHGLVVAFDAVRGRVVWRDAFGDVATDIQVDSVSHLVFVTSVSYRQQQSNLVILSGATGKTLATVPTGSGDDGIAFDAARKLVYVASNDDGVIYTYTIPGIWQDSVSSLQVTQVARLHIGSHPEGVVVNARVGQLYVADIADHMLRVLDEGRMQVVATIQVGAGPLHPLRVDEKTGYVYIVCSTAQELDVVESQKNSVIARVPVAPYPEGITIDTTTGRIYIADEGNNEHANNNYNAGNTISVVDGKTFAFLGTLQVGAAPDGVESDPALHRVYVALEASNAVVEVSDSTNVPLKIDETLQQTADAHRATQVLRWASILTVLLMVATIVGATYMTYVRDRKAQGSSRLAADATRSDAQELSRAMESPRTPPVDASSRSERHSLRS